MKKIKNFKIKNCEDCFYWQSEERSESKEFCYIHQQNYNQPLGIFKQIINERKELRKWRIMLWTPVLVLVFCLFFLLFYFPIDVASIISVIKCLVYLPLFIWMIVETEKDAKVELKELNQKKSEWIIEYK